VIGLVRSVNGKAKVVGLNGRESGELDVELSEMGWRRRTNERKRRTKRRRSANLFL